MSLPPPPPPPCCPTPSANNTTIPPATQIIDNGLNTWTVDGTGKCFENNVNVGGCANVSLLLWWGNQQVGMNIYANTVSFGWFQFNPNGSSFVSIAGDPRPAGGPSPNGTTIPIAAQIIDPNGDVWTVDSSGRCFKNGIQVGGCANVTELELWGGSIYAGTESVGWYKWNGTTFVQVTKDPSGRWFSPLSIWRWKIPANPTVTSFSAAAITNYGGSFSGIAENVDNFTPVFLEAPIGTPTISLTFGAWTAHNVPWGGSAMNTSVANAAIYFAAHSDTDAKICTQDDNTGVFFSEEFVSETGTPGTATLAAAAFAVNSSTGPGWWINGNFSGGTDPYIDATGASLCGGLVLASEVAAGSINHALSMNWPSAFVYNTATAGPVFPAFTSDGSCTNASNCVPEGSLLQADPTRSDAQWISDGVSQADLIIIHALQAYGAYVMDSTGSSTAAIYFQNGMGNGSTMFPGIGPMPAAIMSHMRFVQGPTAMQILPLDTRLTPGLVGFVTTP